MKEIAYYDGMIGTPQEVKIPFDDRVHFFGDGVYEAALGAGGKIFLLQEHLDRLYSSAAMLDIRIPMEKEALKALLLDLLSRADNQISMVYWQVTRGVSPRSHTYEEGMEGKVWVLIRPSSPKDPRTPVQLITREDTRFYHCNIKTLNLLPSVMAAQAAKQAQAAETVLHRNQTVTECSHSNVAILKDGALISHPNDQWILRGITKTQMIQDCWRLGIPVYERTFTLEELMDADEILISSSTAFCRYADSVDGHAAGGKDPETRQRIQRALLEAYERETGTTCGWL